MSIDLDDTLSDFNNSWLSLYNEKSGDNLTVDQITDWELTQFVLPEWRDRIFSEDIVYSKGFFLNVPVKEYAVDFVEWACFDYNVSIVSACNFDTVPDKAKWIRKNLPFFDINNFIPCYYKHKIKTDIMVDDGAHNFHNFKGTKCLIDRPWNKKFTQYDYCRFNNLFEVREYLDLSSEETEMQIKIPYRI